MHPQVSSPTEQITLSIKLPVELAHKAKHIMANSPSKQDEMSALVRHTLEQLLSTS